MLHDANALLQPFRKEIVHGAIKIPTLQKYLVQGEHFFLVATCFTHLIDNL